LSDPILKALAEEVSELASSPEHAARRRLWANFHALRAPRTLVNYAMYTYVWARDIAPEGSIRHAGPGLARDIEIQLRARLWKAANIPDDEPLMPTIWLPCPHPPGEDRLWGVALPARQTDDLGSYKPIPPLKEETDLGWLRFPSYEEDSVRRNQLEDEARELTGGLLPVKSHTDELHFGPFEWAVRMRGMDNLLLDVYDRPAFVHALMDFITQGMVRYHLAREAAGGVDAESSWGFHMYYDDAPRVWRTGWRDVGHTCMHNPRRRSLRPCMRSSCSHTTPGWRSFSGRSTTTAARIFQRKRISSRRCHISGCFM